MTKHPLHHRRILVVEDEYIIACELSLELEDVEATVVGPVGNLADAMALINSGESVDGAILDVNLGGQLTYPLADLLAERGVPFVFTTGYDAAMIPARFASVVRCQKPVEGRRVTQAIGEIVH
jgi:CheY-like chemotaxis protein